MNNAGMIRRCRVELRVWQYFRWIFLAYGLVCVAIGGLAYRQACAASVALTANMLPVRATSLPPPMGKAAAASETMTALRMEMQATNFQLVYAMNHEFEQVELRAWLAMLAGAGIVLFTLYRWRGSLAARIALELAEPPQASGEPGNA